MDILFIATGTSIFEVMRGQERWIRTTDDGSTEPRGAEYGEQPAEHLTETVTSLCRRLAELDTLNAARGAHRLTSQHTEFGLPSELSSLWWLKQHGDIGTPRIIFLSSGTDDGQLAADACTRAWTAYAEPSHCETRVVAGLDAEGAENAFLTKGLPTLVNVVREEITGADHAVSAQRDLPRVGINITGGYKGAVPFLSFLGCACGAELIYFHEQKRGKVPRAPVRIRPLPRISWTAGKTPGPLVNYFEALTSLQELGSRASNSDTDSEPR